MRLKGGQVEWEKNLMLGPEDNIATCGARFASQINNRKHYYIVSVITVWTKDAVSTLFVVVIPGVVIACPVRTEKGQSTYFVRRFTLTEVSQAWAGVQQGEHPRT
jgi:hypothetical protein